MATPCTSLPLSTVSLAQAALPCICPLSTALLAASRSPVHLPIQQDLGSAAWKGRGPLLADVLRLHLAHRDDRVEVVGELAQAHLALVGWGPACRLILAARTCLWVKALGEPVHARGSPPRTACSGTETNWFCNTTQHAGVGQGGGQGFPLHVNVNQASNPPHTLLAHLSCRCQRR